MTIGPFVLTDHAIARYRQRVNRPTGDVRAELAEMVRASHFVRLQGNGELWRMSGTRRDPRWRFIAVRQLGYVEIVTVIPPHGKWAATK